MLSIRVRASAPLTPRQEAYVRQKIWGGGPGNEVLVKAYSVDMTRDNLRTLRDTVWLNDEVNIRVD